MARRLNPFIVKKMGDWDGAIRFFNTMGLRVKTVTLQSQEEICRKIKANIVKHLLAQDLNWEQLARVTKDRKNQKNRDLILIDTELYMKSIVVYQVSMTWYVGVKKGIAYRRKGSFVNLDRVAFLNEKGTVRTPARPLWEPTFAEFGGFKGVKAYVTNAIYEKLKKQAKGSPVAISKKDILSKL